VRILHVITSINRGGAENQLMSLVRLQRAAGHAVMVAYLREDGNQRAEMEEIGAEVVDLDMGARRILRAAFRLRREIARFMPTIVSAHLQPAELCARLALLGTPSASLPLVITKHNLGVFGRLPGETCVARWVAKRAGAVIAVSDSVKALCDRIGCAAVTVYNAVDLAPYDGQARQASLALRREWGASEQEVIVGTVGRLLPVKAIHVLLRAFESYLKRAERGAKLIVVGEGPLQDELERLAAELGIKDKVVFTGFRRDIPAVMGAFDVVALTSNSEGLPMVLLEAMAASKPVVATRVGGVLELVVDGVTGKLVPPGDPKAAADALAFFDLASNRGAYGSAGRRRVSESFSLDAMLRGTMEAYASTLAAPSSPSAARETPRA
jgi:glycosyltransferase involved in cell wall biosynthesis